MFTHPLQKCSNLRYRGHPYELPDFWPPNSTDLDPADYKICGIIRQRVCQTNVYDMNDLMQHLTDVWAGVEQSVIDDAIDHACLRTTGGQIEHSP